MAATHAEWPGTRAELREPFAMSTLACVADDAATRRSRGARGEEEMDAEARRYAASLGARLRAVRRQKRLSLQAVEERSGEEFKASVLGAYERGERSISVPRLKRLAEIYDVPVDQLLPERGGTANGTEHPGEGGGPTGRVRKVTIDLERLAHATGPERDLLRQFLASIQVQRQDFNGEVITIRGDDLRVMASMFGESADSLAARLGELGLLRRP